MENTKQTTVEWIEYQVQQQGITHFFSLREILQQAKEMEEQQTIDDYVNGMYKGQEVYFGEDKIKLDVNHLPYSYETAKQYHTKTYGSK